MERNCKSKQLKMQPKIDRIVEEIRLCSIQPEEYEKYAGEEVKEYLKVAREKWVPVLTNATKVLLEASAAGKSFNALKKEADNLWCRLGAVCRMKLTAILCEQTREFVCNHKLAGSFLRNTWEHGHMNLGMCPFFGYDFDRILSWFEYVDKAVLMTQKERAIIRKMPQAVTIYRGVSNSRWQGISWTTSLEVAMTFAERTSRGTNKKRGYIFSATAKPTDILAYFDGRQEQEMVIDYRKLNNVTGTSLPHIRKCRA